MKAGAPSGLTSRLRSVVVGLVLTTAGTPGSLWSPPPLLGQTVRYSGSISYSTGSYVFAERTHSFWLSNGLSVGGSKLSASATLPLIVQNSGVVSVVADQPVPTGGEGSGVVGRRSGDGPIGTRRRDGAGSGTGTTPTDSAVVFRDRYALEVGDPSLRVTYDAYSSSGFIRSVSLNLGAKAPLRGLESGVGTGEWDAGAGASVALGVGSTWFFLDGAHWWFGDLPELELRDGVMYSAGVSRLFGESGTSLLASVSGSSRIVPTAAAPVSVSVGLSRFLERGRSFSVGVTAGLSEASPDLSAYFGWSLPVGGSRT
ncbi:MAG: hypothetical protein U5R14_04225 [Gemmatimonadota bacterium]|nr:hypothetical protein [Gemmatimonadota bacterium]